MRIIKCIDIHYEYQVNSGCDTCRELFTTIYDIMVHILHSGIYIN